MEENESEDDDDDDAEGDTVVQDADAAVGAKAAQKAVNHAMGGDETAQLWTRCCLFAPDGGWPHADIQRSTASCGARHSNLPLLHDCFARSHHILDERVPCRRWFYQDRSKQAC